MNQCHSTIYFKWVILWSLSLFIVSGISSQEKYDLKRCIETGLERNFELRISKNNQSISDNNLTPGNAGLLPVVDLTTSYAGTLRNRANYPADGSTVLKDNNIDDAGLDAGVSLNWTVFDGLNMFTSYEKLKELQKTGELNTRMAIENFIGDISGEYFNFIQQRIQYNNLKSAVKLSKERLRIVEERYKIGSMSRLDLQQARVDFNADSSRLIRQQETLFASRIRLNRMMSVADVEQNIVAADTVIVFNQLLSKDELWTATLKSNTLILLAERDKNISILDLKSAQSKNYPYLKLNAGYGYSTDKYGASTYRRQDYLGLNYGLTLGFNIFDGMNRRRQQQNAKIQIENRTLEAEQLQLSLKSDFSNMWMAYQNNMELTALEQENLDNAKLNYDIAIERYKLGDLSGIELREAQNSLLEAEERLVQAQYSTKLCEISLLQISGKAGELLK
jgi:outer membrane protein TolC